MKLRDWLPSEALGGEYVGERFLKFIEDEIVSQYGVVYSNETGEIERTVSPWPGPQMNVSNWVVLEDGHAIGWNENPSTGWSFPIALAPLPKGVTIEYVNSPIEALGMPSTHHWAVMRNSGEGPDFDDAFTTKGAARRYIFKVIK